jgi:hypothetical protein
VVAAADLVVAAAAAEGEEAVAETGGEVVDGQPVVW